MTCVNVCAPGHLDPLDSYGLIACELSRELTRLGVHVNALALGRRQMDSQPPDVAAVTAQPIRAALGGICLGYPTTYARHGALVQAGPRVAVCMFESTKLPAGWVEPLNRCDAVVAPSWFCWEVFRRAGVRVPSYVVPLGVGDVYTPAERTPGRPFTFLAFLDRGKRKGGMVALQAFLRAFGDDTAYRLVLKSRDPKVKIDLLNANITLVQRDMSEEELYRLYLDCDVMINANRGEGFGLLPREMAATGGIALATDWGGTADDLEVWGHPLPYTLVEADWRGAKNLEGQDLGVWAEPDVSRIAEILKDVALNREAYQVQARLAAPVVRRLYSWPKFAERVFEIWQEVAERHDKPERLYQTA